MDTKRFYSRVAQLRDELPQVSSLFITSTDIQEDGGRPGVVCEARRELACKRIAARTHRLSTPEEIEQFHIDQLARQKHYQEIEMRNKQQSIVVMSPETAAMMASAFTSAQAPAVGGEQRAPSRKGA
jgi:hypothetical protein